jgi:hypothetical protein
MPIDLLEPHNIFILLTLVCVCVFSFAAHFDFIYRNVNLEVVVFFGIIYIYMFVVNLPNVYLLVSHNMGLSVIFLLQKAGCPKEPENIHKLECNLCSFSLNVSQHHVFSQVVMEYKCVYAVGNVEWSCVINFP